MNLWKQFKTRRVQSLGLSFFYLQHWFSTYQPLLESTSLCLTHPITSRKVSALDLSCYWSYSGLGSLSFLPRIMELLSNWYFMLRNHFMLLHVIVLQGISFKQFQFTRPCVLSTTDHSTSLVSSEAIFFLNMFWVYLGFFCASFIKIFNFMTAYTDP